MYFQLRQQAKLMSNVKKHDIDLFKSMKQHVQKTILMKKQLKIERHRNVQLFQFVKTLNFMKREDFDNLFDHKVDFDVVFINYSMIIYQMKVMKRKYIVKDEILKRYKEMY